jgi:adenosylcobyric acid synthase
MILRKSGMAKAIIEAHGDGKTVLGICGGYQMLGKEITDPQGIESNINQLPGLNLLPITTELDGTKVTKQVSFKLHAGTSQCTGYEIHNGRTKILSANIETLNVLEDGSTDGCFTENCYGTYIHGILDNAEFVNLLLQPHIKSKSTCEFDYFKFKEEQYDKLADHVRKHVDIELFYKILRNII